MTGAQDLLLQAEGLGKCYLRDAKPMQQMGNLLFGRQTGDPFWALSPLDLAVGRGDALGVIGRNGSGKSTLLQMLTGTLTPSVGQIRHRGRVAGLLELGAGFNPDFTGRENATLNATSLGLTARQIQDRLPQIAGFADIGSYFDRPVSEYSSGMFARLAFAVAIHVDAELLVVDEILAVGDSLFQRKCHNWMRQFRAAGGGLVFVSQNATEMASICPRAIWLDKGKVQAAGGSHQVAAAYQAHLLGTAKAHYTAEPQPDSVQPDAGRNARFAEPMLLRIGQFRPEAPQHGQGGARVIGAGFRRLDGSPVNSFEGGEDIEMQIDCQAERGLTRPIIGFIFRDGRGQNLFGDNSFLATCEDPPQVQPGERISAVFRFRFPYLPVGLYHLAPSILEGTQDDHVHLHWMEEALQIRVVKSPVEFGLVGVPLAESSLRPLPGPE